VAVRIGVEGWAAIGGSVYAGYKLFEARADVRDRYTEYYQYNTSHQTREDWSFEVNNLLRQNYESARDAEEALWAGLALSGGVAAWRIGTAVMNCAPLLAAPTA
jgi:hypothetical protein